jgi:hypothetical protein
MTLTDSAPVDVGAIAAEALFEEARRRRHRRWASGVLLVTAVVVTSGVAVAIEVGRSSSPTGSLALLSRPLHFPSLVRGGSCPTSPGTTFNNSYFGGIALGSGPVRVLLADSGDIRHGRVDLYPSDVRGWSALQTLWFAMPGYNGPFVIRAERIGQSGPIKVQHGSEPGAGPLVVPAGPTINTAHGYRTVPGGTWVKSGGCYAWQVDGLNFSEVIVIDALGLGVNSATK